MAVTLISLVGAKASAKNLFILSGQSNMARLDPNMSFAPAVAAAFGKDNVIVVKDAQGGQPIRRWYKKWKPPVGTSVQDESHLGDLYDRLMAKVRQAAKDQELESIVFVWMQGESDAKTRMADVYEASLKGLIQQLRDDLGRQDVCVVIGRLSDHGNGTSGGGWNKVREVQVKTAHDDPLAAWVDTDEFNGPSNGLHYTKDGYKALGALFAEKAIELIRKKPAGTAAGGGK